MGLFRKRQADIGARPVPGHPDLVSIPPEKVAQAISMKVFERQTDELPGDSADLLVGGIPTVLQIEVSELTQETFRVANGMVRLGYLTRTVEIELLQVDPSSEVLAEMLQSAYDQRTFGETWADAISGVSVTIATGRPEGIDVLPGEKEVRAIAAQAMLHGAKQQVPEDGPRDDQLLGLWAYGVLVRACEESLPADAGRA